MLNEICMYLLIFKKFSLDPIPSFEDAITATETAFSTLLAFIGN